MLKMIIEEDSHKIDYILKFLMNKCSRILRQESGFHPSEEVCINQGEIDYDNFRLLKGKLEENPKCIEELIDDLVGYKP